MNKNNNIQKDFSNVQLDPTRYPMKINPPAGPKIRREDLLKNFIEIKLPDRDSFLKIKETLTRMGVGSYKEKTLRQICHILHKKGRYYLVHFKELMAMDGLPVELSIQDYLRRNQIAIAIENWGMCEILSDDVLDAIDDVYCHVIIIPHKEKKSWNILSNYEVGSWVKDAAEASLA